jgi:hypothetical protein
MRIERSALMLSSRVVGKARSEQRNRRSKLVALIALRSHFSKCALLGWQVVNDLWLAAQAVGKPSAASVLRCRRSRP